MKTRNIEDDDILGCGREAYALLEIRHVTGAKRRMLSVHLCRDCYDRIESAIHHKIGELEEPDFN
jgi:hypothetical protein